MKVRELLFVVAIAVAMAFYFTKNRNVKKPRTIEVEEIEEVASGSDLKDKSMNELKIETINNSVSTVQNSSEKPEPSGNRAGQISDETLKQFSNHIKNLNSCLGLSNSASTAEKIEPSIDNLLVHLSKSLGDVAVQMEDWTQVEVIDDSSTKKRIRVDFDYLEGNIPTKRLSMYKINSYGMPEIVELTADQANNPNDAYVESLKDDVQVIADERGARAYFANGEEVIFSMKNGILQTMSVNKLDKSFNCFNLDQEFSSCSCP